MNIQSGSTHQIVSFAGKNSKQKHDNINCKRQCSVLIWYGNIDMIYSSVVFPLQKVETKSERAASKIFKRKLRFLISTSIHIKHCNALSRQGAIDQLKYMNMFEGWVSQMVFELFPRLTALQYLNCSRCRITLTFSVWVQHHN